MENNYQERILIDNDYFATLIQDIHSAKKYIDMETYIFSEDTIGKKVITALVDAAKRGVKIRLLIDGIGTYTWNPNPILIESGIQIKTYHPVFWLVSRWPRYGSFFEKISHLLRHINSRNHRKTCVIDDEMAFVGSANITEGASQNGTLIKWHDITVKLMGAPLEDLRFAFNKAWKCISFKEKLHSLFNRIHPDPLFRLNFSWKRRRYLYKDLLLKIKSCQKRIWITNAYFIPKPFLLKKLIRAAKSGVDVRIIVPKNPDVIGISFVTRSFYAILLKAGVRVMQHQPGILHSKIMILDDWFCVGSSNLNHRSLKYDLEVDVVIQTDDAKQVIENLFKKYESESIIVEKKNIKYSFLETIITKFILVFERWL